MIHVLQTMPLSSWYFALMSAAMAYVMAYTWITWWNQPDQPSLFYLGATAFWLCISFLCVSLARTSLWQQEYWLLINRICLPMAGFSLWAAIRVIITRIRHEDTWFTGQSRFWRKFGAKFTT